MKKQTLEKDYLTVKELCKYLGVSDKTIYRYLAMKEIPAFKVGGMWRFNRKSIELWLKRKEENGARKDRETI